MNGSNDVRPGRPSALRILVRLGVALSATMLAVSVAPSTASAQTTELGHRTTVPAAQATVARHAGAVTPNGYVYQVVCDYTGCSAWFTVTWPQDRAWLYVQCTNGWASSDTFYGQGSGSLRADCARWGAGSPVRAWFYSWTA